MGIATPVCALVRNDIVFSFIVLHKTKIRNRKDVNFLSGTSYFGKLGI